MKVRASSPEKRLSPKVCQVCDHDEWQDVKCVCVDECNSEYCAGGLTIVKFVPIVEADNDW